MTNSKTENNMSVIDLDEVRKKVEEQKKEQELIDLSSDELRDLNMKMMIDLINKLTEMNASTNELLHEVSMTYGEAIKDLQRRVDRLSNLIADDEEE